MVNADFRRFYGVNPMDLGWWEFCRLLRGLPPESGFLASLRRDMDDMDWRAALDRATGADPAPRQTMSLDAFMAQSGDA